MLNSPVWRGWPQYAFGVGLVVGGLLSAAVLVTVGSLVRLVAPPAFGAAMIAVWFAVVALREVGALSFGLPQNARLVPESVLRHGRFWGPFEFGLEMGTGVRTYVTSGLAYVVVPVLALLAGWAPALLAGVGFGLGRTVMTVSALRYGRDAEWDRAFDRHARPIHGILLSAFAAALAVALVAAL